MEGNLNEIMQRSALLKALDPRPIDPGRWPETLAKWLLHSGYLPNDMTDDEFRHLGVKMSSYFEAAITDDRENRLLP